jgi:hypothetical protein
LADQRRVNRAIKALSISFFPSLRMCLLPRLRMGCWSYPTACGLGAQMKWAKGPAR